MKKMQEGIKKKYSCDRTTTTTRLEDLLQDAAVSTNSLLSMSGYVLIKYQVIIRSVYSTSGGERTAKWIQDPCEQLEQESKVGHPAETTQPHHRY